ncbi:MAG TPA: DUF2878 domain-containing protein [Dyella sp.]|uniref:DUF2878 domain-containing protein n=1 Tax=Dyella sp. TaxID=1869338 RepID=UPI002D7A3AE4|nr:DUF2878 domain-containing protein [Dyella sp.]HET6554305.1 DUF2878 domain-containing protein [Dyella sp.]
MMFWLNLLGYQCVWFLLVRGASTGRLWLPLLAGALFVLTQLATAAHVRRELRLLVGALLIGGIVDGVAAATGWLRYATPSPAWPAHGAPVWILMLWACFATTLNRSLAVLRSRLWLAALLGGFGAPLAYLAAARGWGAVQLSPWPGMAWIAACWALALPMLLIVNQHGRPHDRARLP